MRTQYLSVLLLSGLAAACPKGSRQTTTTAAAPAATTTAAAAGAGSTFDMAAAVRAIMPSSGSCAGAQFPDECRTADQAAPFIAKACESLSTAECAATVALMGLESVDMKFKHNVSPGRPGQGTANMMMPNFVSEYATDLFGAAKVAGKSPNDVLALVTPDEYNFGSAAWFLTTKCTADVRSSLKTGTDAGWIAYNSNCLGVDGTLSERLAYWNRAKTAFNL
ncbi:85eea3a9-dd18-43f0-8a31-52928eb69e5c [Thermothielavioides terrestris]|uniref:85eea3a9-dd18-43f0-8a31-52928eb69e5c n=1 Tax=Thermothielavioides terrestris TaxID=2587410 RepID=A0A3S4EXS8_9PEZI|nr:85eea3a9-dd18-43f0-8a31-52928eb69e5c [Thermothielavioides terrestris]